MHTSYTKSKKGFAVFPFWGKVAQRDVVLKVPLSRSRVSSALVQEHWEVRFEPAILIGQ
jgi:hypothetical protein